MILVNPKFNDYWVAPGEKAPPSNYYSDLLGGNEKWVTCGCWPRRDRCSRFCSGPSGRGFVSDSSCSSLTNLAVEAGAH